MRAVAQWVVPAASRRRAPQRQPPPGPWVPGTLPPPRPASRAATTPLATRLARQQEVPPWGVIQSAASIARTITALWAQHMRTWRLTPPLPCLVLQTITRAWPRPPIPLTWVSGTCVRVPCPLLPPRNIHLSVTTPWRHTMRWVWASVITYPRYIMQQSLSTKLKPRLNQSLFAAHWLVDGKETCGVWDSHHSQ